MVLPVPRRGTCGRALPRRLAGNSFHSCRNSIPASHATAGQTPNRGFGTPQAPAWHRRPYPPACWARERRYGSKERCLVIGWEADKAFAECAASKHSHSLQRGAGYRVAKEPEDRQGQLVWCSDIHDCGQRRRPFLDQVQPPTLLPVLPRGAVLADCQQPEDPVSNAGRDVNSAHQENQDDMEIRQSVLLKVVVLQLVEGDVNGISCFESAIDPLEERAAQDQQSVVSRARCVLDARCEPSPGFGEQLSGTDPEEQAPIEREPRGDQVPLGLQRCETPWLAAV